MQKLNNNEINRGYLNFIKDLSNDYSSRRQSSLRSIFWKIFQFSQLVTIPLIYIFGAFLLLFLRVRLVFAKKRVESRLHLDAINYIEDFIHQYPMHLYPILAKCLEISFLKNNIARLKKAINGKIVEFAIGEGSLSKRIFLPEDRIIGLELNPYSLKYTQECHHVATRVIADCLNPPIIKGGAAAIICNNLLHHVTDKKKTLRKWAEIAPYAIFNENTNYWASGWIKPYLYRLIGLDSLAEKIEDKIKKRQLQSLRTIEELDLLVGNYYEIISENSFFSAKVFFYCSIFSFLLFCYGPPTPKRQKVIMNNLCWPLTRVLSFHLAKTLIEFDAIQNRDTDTYVIWSVKSNLIQPEAVNDEIMFSCPDCGEILQNNYCRKCGRLFEVIDDMLFLLPNALNEKISNYRTFSSKLDKEHL